MQISEWSILLLLLKLANYMAIAALAGTLLMRFILVRNRLVNKHNSQYINSINTWQITWVALGLVAAMLQVPIEAGAMSESGFAGMWDAFMLDFMWQSVIGDQAALRIPAFIIALIALITWQKLTGLMTRVNLGITIIALLSIIYSFTFTGHSAEKNLLIKSMFFWHLIAIASWGGALWPLYKSCKLFPISTVKPVMHQFGQLAIIVVLLMLASGIFLLFQHLASFSELFTTNYGQLIMLKLLLVSAVLLMGAWHKFSLVPNLTQENIATLKRSISVEMLVAILVILTTSVLTTLVGPPV
ncbi:CopD family protein [Alteromonas sp. M12]|uniref:copper resistance D family protein n=1 Tax=Alteromonas sp. M12 TaxID=3135644 RepID=UPI00319DC11D